MTEVELLMKAAQVAPAEDVHDAFTLLVTRHNERQAEADRVVRHAAAVEACRECADRIVRLQAELELAELEFWNATDAFRIADGRLDTLLQNKPAAYATKLKIENYEAGVNQLRAELAEARAKVGRADQKRSEINSALLRATEELSARPGGLAFREEQLRPRRTSEPHYSGGVLSGVR